MNGIHRRIPVAFLPGFSMVVFTPRCKKPTIITVLHGDITMTATNVLIGVLIGSVIILFHAMALKFATRLMVHVSVQFGRALSIILLEYLAVFLVCIILFWLLDNQTIIVLAGAFIYLFAGAALIDIWITTADGDPLGMGNGVLNQAIQIPLLIPLLIIAWWLYDILV
jgi:hypothetical protein